MSNSNVLFDLAQTFSFMEIFQSGQFNSSDLGQFLLYGDQRHCVDKNVPIWDRAQTGRKDMACVAV